ncbi:hypothetical protein [Bradyrhizobium zhanjiangense]|uniref:Uncharacterized protein n=1 Tax=Bradyrhizobium zhanjiangense TaxID=1325107 RepID=A0A4Q0RSD1_9BRAD|nr:hypothetical protein [Bradyrhizobium zhanjiangense]RXH21183.1 hypothetical protein XH94_38020 [Bradyrhizobium zhanjiangense]
MKEEAEKLNALGAAYNHQSTFNALAASAAGVSALCQTVVVYWTGRSWPEVEGTTRNSFELAKYSALPNDKWRVARL